MSQVLQNIWNRLSTDGMTESSFENWQKNFMSDSQVQVNVYKYLKQNNYTQSDANTWATNISKDIAVSNAESKPDAKIPKSDWDIDKTLGKLSYLQATSTTVPGKAGFGIAKNGLALIGGMYNAITGQSSSEDVVETDEFQHNVVLDFFDGIAKSAKRDFLDTKDTDAIERINDAIKNKKDVSTEDVNEIVKNYLEVAKIGPTDEARAYQKIYDQNKEKHGGVAAFFQALGENPSFAIQTTAGSFGRMFGTIYNSEEGLSRALKGGVGAGTTALVAGQLGPQIGIPEELVTVPTATLAGIFGTVSGTMERASTFTELIQEQLREDGKEFTIENVKEFFNNDEVVEFKDPRLSALNIKGTRAEIVRRRALNRGIAIGVIDTFSGLLGGSVVGKMGKGAYTKAAIGATGSAFAVGGGIASEVGGQIAGGQEFETGEILLEGIAEKAVAMTGVTTLPTLLKKKSTYSIHGESMSESEFLNTLSAMTDEEVAAIQDKIKVENDDFTKNRFLRRSNIGTYMSQISPTVTNEEDRRKLANKQMELERLKRKNKSKKESSRDTRLDTKIKNLQEEINSIIDSYGGGVIGSLESGDISIESIEEGENKAKKTRQARFDFLKNEITEGVKKSRSYKNLDINTEEMSADEAVNAFMDQEFENLGYDLTLLNEKLSEATDSKVKRQIRKKIKEVETEMNGLEAAAQEAATTHGFLLEDNATGKMKIVINKDMALTDGVGNINVAAHELLHAVLRNVFIQETGQFRAKELKGIGVQTGQKLLDFLVDNKQLELLFDGEIIQRLKQYAEGDIKGQEVMNLLSDAMVDVDYDSRLEAGLVGLGQRLSEILQAYLPERFAKKINFADGKQVFDFIKTFNRAIQGDKVAGRIVERVRRGGFKVDESAVEKKEKGKAAKAPMSKAASDRVQEIYEQEGVDGAFEIIEQFKPITTRIARRYRDVPGYDEQLLIDEIETGRRGIYDMIANEYKPESGVPLAAYINTYLPARAIEAANRILDTEFTQDVTEVKGLAAEEVAEPTVEQTKPKRKKTVLAERLGISDKVVSAVRKILPDLDISNLTFKSLKNQIPSIIGDLFGISPSKIKSGANITKKELLSAQMFINKNADLLIAMLPEGATTGGTATGVPKTLLNEFYTKTDRVKAAKTGSKAGLAVQQKNNIDKTEFLEVFGIIEGKPVRTDRNTSARVLALANQLGKMITNQTVRQELAEQGAPQTDINRISEGKSKGMFSKAITNKSQKTSLYISEIVEKQYIQNKLKALGLTTIPRGELYIEITENNEVIKSSNYDGKLMQTLVPGEKYTWETYLANRINNFLSEYPQYYDHFRISFTGSVKRTALGSVENFESLINYTDQIKNTTQVNPGRNFYNRDLTKKEKAKGLKGKRQRKDVRTRDNSIDENKVENLIAFYEDMANYLKENKNDIWFLQEFLLHGSIDQNNFGRRSAIFIGFAVDQDGNAILNMPVVEEHSPQAEIMRILAGAAIDNRVSEVAPLVKSLFSQLSILERDDPGGKLKSSNGKDFYNKVVPQIINENLSWLKPGYASIYRLMKHGVNPNGYALIKDDMTIAEYFNVDNLTEDQAREKIIESFETGIKPSRVPFSKGKMKIKNVVNATLFSRSTQNETKGITVLDFDDTLATSKSLIRYTQPDGTKGTLTPEQYASTYQDLQDLGYEFDFSEFNKVVDGKVAPLFQKALKLQSKFGPENMFVLTARPAEAAPAIFTFLQANGLNIPLKNITGLANSTSEAKALWIAGKVSEGFNDFYFADDALQNVQAVKNMLDQFDVKSKVQQARVNFSKPSALDNKFNDILEQVTGIESQKRFSDIKARKRGASKGKFRLFIPPSHEDFAGLLYNFMGKGKLGNQHRDFFEEALIKPLNRGYREIDMAKQAIANDYKALNKKYGDVKNKFTRKTPDGDFTYQDAIRVFLWDKHGHNIPGLSPTDQANLVNIVNSDPQLKAYAEALNEISRLDDYVAPQEAWDKSGNIRIDLIDATGRVGRAQYFTEFQENVDVIFSEENLNKIEAAYGTPFREALEDMLHRIKTGVNRPKGQNAVINRFMNWLNAAVGSVMFFNMRSAALQQLSIVNYINFADNNIFAAAKAFANQVQYWADFAFIFNSDMLKQRRGGIQTDINGAELADTVRKSKNPVASVLNKLLTLGFTPTQLSDNFAIAIGGASFYRNRINKYIKEGMSQKEAEAAAFTDFQDITQSTQQSARPDMTSQQQAMWIGKIILNFQNITSQYNRIIKKAGLDIIKRRITKPNTTQLQSDLSNMSRILYYGAIQNLIFYSLQTALFAVAFGDEDDSNDEYLKKKERIINGSIDSILRGSGIYGAVVSTLKNMYIANREEREKSYNPDESSVLIEMLNFSPVVGIKARKIVNAEKTLNYNKKIIPEMKLWDIDNPLWSAYTNRIEGTTNAPVNRILTKTINVRDAMDNQYTTFQRIMMMFGYNKWNQGIGDRKIEAIKKKVKNKKKSKGRSKQKTRN